MLLQNIVNDTSLESVFKPFSLVAGPKIERQLQIFKFSLKSARYWKNAMVIFYIIRYNVRGKTLGPGLKLKILSQI